MKGRAVLVLSWLVGGSGCAGGNGPLVAFLGDSLTSGWRLPESEAYPAVLGRILREKGARAVERLMGMLLVMLAVQMFLNGLKRFLYSLPLPIFIGSVFKTVLKLI